MSLLSAAHHASEGLYLARGLVLAWLLGPQLFGVWSSMRVVRGFSILTPLGSLAGMGQLAPLAAGRSDTRLARQYLETASWISIAGSVAFSLVIATLAGINVFGGEYRLAWIVFAGFLVLTQCTLLLRRLWRVEHRFERVSGLLLAEAAATTVFGLLGAWWAGLEGFLAALFVSMLGVLGVGLALGSAGVRPRFDLRRARELIGTGIHIALAEATLVLQSNADRVLIWVLLGTRELGVYAVVSHVVASLQLLPTGVVSVLSPRLLEDLGRGGSPRAAWSILGGATPLLGQIACPLVGFAAVAFPYVVRWLLPEYLAAIEPGRVLLLSTWFMLVSSLPDMVLVSLGAAKRVAAMRAACIALTLCLGAAALYAGTGLLGVAVATAISMAAQAVLLISAAVVAVGLPARATVSVLARTALPYALLLGLIFLVRSFDAGPAPDLASDLVAAILQATVVCVPTLLLAGFGARRWRREGRANAPPISGSL